MSTARHPAKFTDAIVEVIQRALPPDVYRTVLDPFAGTGRIHRLAQTTWGIELEPEWAAMHEDTVHDDARNVRSLFGHLTIDAIATSPCYGNRMADDHTPSPEDTSTRNTYRHTLGRPLTAGSAAGMQWGDEYRTFHELVWGECVAVLRDGGRFVLNVKDHIREGVVKPVSGWHATTLCRLGLRLVEIHPIAARGNRMGANGQARVDNEWVLVFVKDKAPAPTLFEAQEGWFDNGVLDGLRAELADARAVEADLRAQLAAAVAPKRVSKKLARSSDPSTSHAGARDVAKRAGSQEARLLVAFDEHRGGLTADEAGAATGLSDNPKCCYWRRVTSLLEAGLIEDTGVEREGRAGSAQAVRRITTAGVMQAADLRAAGQTVRGVER